jgi:hypothetical protein
VVSFTYQYSTGDVLTDLTLPVTGVEARNNLVQVSYYHTFNLLGRTANVTFSLPYIWGTTEGFLGGEYISRSLSGIGDGRARLSVNLLGAPTMNVGEFQELRANPRTIIGASLLIQAPTGHYNPDRLLNLGSNRWAVKPALGLIWPFRPTWLLELELGAWLFSDNDDFLGVTREQDPILSSQFHLIKRIRPGFWASLDVNFYSGGRTTVGQELRADLQRNSRIGGTVLFPFKPQHAIRFSYSTGIVTASGGDFDIFNLSYQYVWR